MAEYAGYIAPKTVDYGAISSGLLSSKLSAEQLRQSQALARAKLDQKELERQQKLERDEDKLLREDLAGIKAAEYVPQKSFNTFATEGLGNIKTKILELNKQKREGTLTTQGYLINYNNLKDQFGQFTSGVASFKTNLEGLTKSVAEGKQSEIGVGLVGMFADTGQLYNKVLGTKDVNGVTRLQQYTIDKDGKEIEDQTITNIGTLAAPSLFSDLAVDYDKKFEDAEKAIGQFRMEQGNVTITDKGAKANFDAQLQTQINGIIPQDIDKARLLANKKGYKVYFTEQQKEGLLKSGTSEKELIKFALNDKGAYSPFLTDAQKTEAYDYAKNNITSRMEYAKTLDEPVRISVSTGGKKTQTEIKRDATYKKSKDAYKSIIELGDKSPYKKRVEKIYRASYPEFGVTSRILYKGPATKENIVGLAIYALGEDGRPEREIDRLLTAEDFFGVYTPRDKKGEEDVEFMTAEDEEGAFNFDK